jgi:hypothetical protein
LEKYWKIRKNTSEDLFLGLTKFWCKNLGGKIRKNTENSEKYSTKFGKIVVKKNRKIHVRAFFSSFFRFH